MALLGLRFVRGNRDKQTPPTRKSHLSLSLSPDFYLSRPRVPRGLWELEVPDFGSLRCLILDEPSTPRGHQSSPRAHPVRMGPRKGVPGPTDARKSPAQAGHGKQFRSVSGKEEGKEGKKEGGGKKALISVLTWTKIDKIAVQNTNED